MTSVWQPTGGSTVVAGGGSLTISAWTGTIEVRKPTVLRLEHPNGTTDVVLDPGTYVITEAGSIISGSMYPAERHEDVPILAVKSAYLNLGAIRGKVLPPSCLPFRASAQCVSYGVDADAQCVGRTTGINDHARIPEWYCTCGFYAMKPDAEGLYFRTPALRNQFGSNVTGVRLDVELSGKVIVAEHGFRAQHQRVLTVTMRELCEQCGDEMATWFDTEYGWCDRCHRLSYAATGRGVHVDQIAERLGVHVVATFT